MIRIYAALGITALGIAWSIVDTLHGLWFQALGTLGTGFFVSFGVAGLKFTDVPMAYFWSSLAIASGGVGHFLSESPYTNAQRQQGLSALNQVFTQLTFTSPNPLPYDQQQQAVTGMFACTQQPWKDAQITVADGMKLAYESPRVSMLDRATGLGNPPPSPERCLDAYRQLRNIAPWAFRQAEANNPWLLKQL